MAAALTFVETEVFTRRVLRLDLEDAMPQLQHELAANPEAGDVEPGTGGLRKVRIPDSSRGKGKRSGARVHYLWLPHRGVIYLVFVYSKDEAETLTGDQRKALRSIVEGIKREGRS
jgi:hypothetical protein